MRLKIPFVDGWFFKKIAHKREYLTNCYNDVYINHSFFFAGNGIGIIALNWIYLKHIDSFIRILLV